MSPDQRVDVSVVVATVNRPGPLARCLTAVSEGTRLPLEVVVVDQGDATANARVLAGIDLPIVHVTQERRGLSVSQNLGVHTARGDVVAVLDDDCVPDSRWLEVVAAEFAAASGPLLLTGRVEPMPVDGARTAAVASRTGRTRRRWTSPGLPWEVGSGNNFAVTRASYLAVGGNHERLGTGTRGRAGNDIDLFHRLVRAGVEAVYTPELLVLHERVTPAERQERRFGYGYGAGAMLGAALRRRDPYVWRMARGWLRLRLSLVRQHRSRAVVREEAAVLFGTVAGFGYGIRLPPDG